MISLIISSTTVNIDPHETISRRLSFTPPLMTWLYM